MAPLGMAGRASLDGSQVDDLLGHDGALLPVMMPPSPVGFEVFENALLRASKSGRVDTELPLILTRP